MNRYYLFTIPVIITIVALSYMLYSHQNQVTQSSTTPNQDAKVTTQSLIQNGSPILGNPDASITIVEWGDYQCTYCHAFYETSKDLLIKEYVDTGKANFVFRDFPLNGPDSVLAAEASYCANDQNKYWDYHDELYKNWAGERTGWVNRKSLDQFANTVGIDTTQFDKCLGDKKYEQRVLDNQKFGEGIGINATPSFLIFNSKKIMKIEGAQPISVFKQVLDSF